MNRNFAILPTNHYPLPTLLPNPTSLAGLEKTIGVSFKDKDLLCQALTHRSASGERATRSHNERLEFLGDAVLQLVTTEFLYNLTDKPEGELTSWRSALVQGNHLSEVAADIKLGEYLFLSRGEEASGGRSKGSTLANALEAIIGAMYLDQGFERVKEFIHTFILVRLKELLARGMHRDEKSVFQEMAQEKLGITPTYRTIDESGPDHEKTFTCAVLLGSEQVALGKGGTKQKAEQAAASAGLKAKGWKS